MQAWTATLAIGECKEQPASADPKSVPALCKEKSSGIFTKDAATLYFSDLTSRVLRARSCWMQAQKAVQRGPGE